MSDQEILDNLIGNRDYDKIRCRALEIFTSSGLSPKEANEKADFIVTFFAKEEHMLREDLNDPELRGLLEEVATS